MQWWDNFVNWFYSDAGSHIVSTVIVPGLAILVAGIIAALIGRGSTKRIVSLHARAERTAAVTAMISAARRAANWNSLSVSEQQHAEHIALECDVKLRLLPTAGSGMAAEWSAHQLAELKKQAVSFSFQASQTLKEFKDRLIEWQSTPSRAKRLFKSDLDSWAYESSLSDQDLVAQQQAWESQQAQTNVAAPAPEVSPAPATQPAPTIEPAPEVPEATEAPVVPEISKPRAAPEAPQASAESVGGAAPIGAYDHVGAEVQEEPEVPTPLVAPSPAPAPDVTARVEDLPRTD